MYIHIALDLKEATLLRNEVNTLLLLLLVLLFTMYSFEHIIVTDLYRYALYSNSHVIAVSLL